MSCGECARGQYRLPRFRCQWKDIYHHVVHRVSRSVSRQGGLTVSTGKSILAVVCHLSLSSLSRRLLIASCIVHRASLSCVVIARASLPRASGLLRLETIGVRLDIIVATSTCGMAGNMTRHGSITCRIDHRLLALPLGIKFSPQPCSSLLSSFAIACPPLITRQLRTSSGRW